MVSFFFHFIFYFIESVKIGLVNGYQSLLKTQRNSFLLKGHLAPAALNTTLVV